MSGEGGRSDGLVLDSEHAEHEPEHWSHMGRLSRTRLLEVLEHESLLQSLPLVIESLDPSHVYRVMRPLVDQLELSNLDFNTMRRWFHGRLHFCTLTDAVHVLGRSRRSDVVVANLGTHDRGLHWVGMFFVRDKSVAVFDSLNWHRPYPFHVQRDEPSEDSSQKGQARVVGPRTFYNAVFRDLGIQAVATTHRYQTIHSGVCGMYAVMFAHHCTRTAQKDSDAAQLIQSFVSTHRLSPDNLLVNDLSILLAFMLEMETLGLAMREDGDLETALMVPANRVDDQISYAIVNDLEDLEAMKRQGKVDKDAFRRGGAHFFSDLEELSGRVMQG